MSDINQVFLAGRIGSLNELREVGQSSVLTLRLATSRFVPSRDKNQEGHTETTWHSVVVWGRDSVYLAENAVVGCLLTVRGRLNFREYIDKDDYQCKVWEVVAEQVSLSPPPVVLEDKPQQRQPQQQRRQPQQQQRQPQQRQRQQQAPDDEHPKDTVKRLKEGRK